MKKIILTIAFIASGMVASAQVGVGTQNPETSLHIVGKNATSVGTSGTNSPGALDAADGITVPVVTNDMTLVSPAVGFPVDGTKVGQMVYSNFTGKQGFYYWDGLKWSAVGGRSDVALTGTLTATITSDTSYLNNTENVYNITTNSSPGNYALTLPNPANNAGRIISVINNGPKGLTVANSFDPNTPIITLRSAIFVSDGTRWIGSGN